MAFRSLRIKALASFLHRGGARNTATDLRLRLFRGDHRLRAITVTSPESNAHRRHQSWWSRHHWRYSVVRITHARRGGRRLYSLRLPGVMLETAVSTLLR